MEKSSIILIAVLVAIFIVLKVIGSTVDKALLIVIVVGNLALLVLGAVSFSAGALTIEVLSIGAAIAALVLKDLPLKRVLRLIALALLVGALYTTFY